MTTKWIVLTALITKEYIVEVEDVGSIHDMQGVAEALVYDDCWPEEITVQNWYDERPGSKRYDEVIELEDYKEEE